MYRVRNVSDKPVRFVPQFVLVSNMGLANSYAGLVQPFLAGPFGVFLMRQFILSLPDELIQAARVDGAGELRIFFSIILPLCGPAVATLGVLTFLTSWNNFLWPLIVLTDDSRYTLPVAVANLVGEHVQDVELMMASSVLTVIPVLVLFLLLQRYYIAGLMVGSVKG